MKVVTFAAGLAAGYVLGTRAGREKFEQIVDGARKVSSHPSVVQAQNKAKEMISTGADAVTAKLASGGPVEETHPPVAVGTAVPRAPRQPATPATDVNNTSPLA